MKKVIKRIPVKFARYVSKYKQIVVQTPDGLDTARIPIEWKARVTEYKTIVVDAPAKPGSKKTYKSPERFPSKRQHYQNVIREEEFQPVYKTTGARKHEVDLKGLRRCRNG